MNLTKIKTNIALGLSAAAMFVATTASTMCLWKFFDEVDMPESLYKVD